MVRSWHVAFISIALVWPDWGLAAERYAAMFADGSRAEEAEVREWCEPNSQAKIAGRVLFDPAVPIRWIIDRTQPPVPKPAMFVEFVGGDRLAGEVVSFSDGQDNPYEIQPQHLVVQPTSELQPPDLIVPSELRVTTDWIQRVVWEHVAPNEYRPGTVWMRTGKSVAFRSLRWTRSGVTLLTSEGVKEFSLADLAEVHLPKLNPWTVYYEQLSVLSSDIKSRLIQLDGNDGSRWTTSLERFQARHHGDRNRPDQWYQFIQPAWSLDSVWLRYRTIQAWRFFASNAVPLSNFAPANVKHTAVFGSGWDWQIDQNAQGGPLQSLDRDFGWGFGVSGTSELTFDLPEMARAVRTQYGLDRTAGTGGCINVEVVDGNEKSIASHSNLVGSAFVSQVDWLELPSSTTDRRHVTFRTEMAHDSRPPNTDPFDVRDIFNWYEPEVMLDQTALETEVLSRSSMRLGGLIGWSLAAGEARAFRAANVIDAFDPRDPQFRRVIRSTERFFILSRKVKVSSTDRWLAVIASRFAENTSATTMQIRVDGRVLGEFDVPIRHSINDPEPMLVSIAPYQGRTVLVEAVVYPSDDKSWVDWRGFSVGSDRPGLLTLFEDDEQFSKILNRETGRAALDNEKPFSGTRSLKVSPIAVSNAAIPGLDALICEAPRIGQYRYIAFAWKKSTGTRIQAQFANQGRFGENGQRPRGAPASENARRGMRRTQAVDERGQRFEYCYEQGVASTQPPIPLLINGELPKEWQYVQRDLFNDFGLFSVTGVSLKSIDGDAAWFDHMYLARTHEDLQYVSTLLVNPQADPPKSDGNGHLSIPRREDFPAEFSRIAPLFSSLDMAHGLIRIVEQNGQTDLLRTHPNDRDKPLILRAGVALPKDRPMMLDMHVSHQPQCDWQLVVRANGEVLTDQLIGEKLTTAQRGWATIQVDLSKFAGQNVLIEVLNQSNNWENESAFWKRIDLIER